MWAAVASVCSWGAEVNLAVCTSGGTCCSASILFSHAESTRVVAWATWVWCPLRVRVALGSEGNQETIRGLPNAPIHTGSCGAIHTRSTSLRITWSLEQLREMW